MVGRRPRIVILGMMTKIPVAGVVWNTMHYMLGFERLGYDVFYVEEHARTPSMLMERPEDDGSLHAADFIQRMMKRFGFEHRWAYRALHDDGRCFGMSRSQISALHASADLIVNLHGSTIPTGEHSSNGRLIFLETDPVDLQLELHEQRQEAIDFLEPHVAFFTWGQNYGNSDCYLPYSERFPFQVTRPPVIPDLWRSSHPLTGDLFTTVGNWRQKERRVVFGGETYTWSKHFEFKKVIDLPTRTNQAFELALSSYTEDDRHMLEVRGWRIRHALDISTDPDAYRRYITASRGEFTVAKDQNVRFRSGWFSERSAAYLAAGRPVINQETGFSSVLPVGRGLFAFSTIDDVLEAVDIINKDYSCHCQGANEVAREYFSYDVVLPPILEHMGLPHSAERSRRKPLPAIVRPFPPGMDIQPVSRFPTELSHDTKSLARRSRVQGALPGYDLVCLAPITPEGHTAWQNVFNQLAHSGHRVFYLRGDGATSSDVIETWFRYPNLIEVTAPQDHVPLVDGPMSEAHKLNVISLLEYIRQEHNIETVVLYAHTADQAAVARQVREQWGCKAVWPARVANEVIPTLVPGDGRSVQVPDRAADALMRWRPAGPEASPGSPTWLQLWKPVEHDILASFPLVSIIVVTRDNLLYTKLCLESLLTNTQYPNYEVIVVDNHSTDGTKEYLLDLAARYPLVRTIFNADNEGFARANNQGLKAALGDILVLLNNDTILPGSWLVTLLRHLSDPSVGLVGPVTNRASNEAQVESTYQTYGELLQFALNRAHAYAGKTMDLDMLVLSCVVMRRDVYTAIGPLDERFEIGMFEDDDLSLRMRQAGYRLLCAEDSFIHHFGQATIGKLAATGQWGDVFESNRRRFEAKWKVSWQAPQGRPNEEYQGTVDRVVDLVDRAVPSHATVVVISKGDPALLELNGRRGWHFPQDEHGGYSGFHPASSEQAVLALDAAIAKGADYLVIPKTAFWWLDHYAGLRARLAQSCRVVADEPNVGIVYLLARDDDGDSLRRSNGVSHLSP